VFAEPYSEGSAMSIRRSETAPPAVPATTPQLKARMPPPKVRAAIEALVTGKVRTITAAAKRVGLSRERLSRAFSEPHNAEALRTRALREVALSSGRAAARLNQLIDSTSQRVALEATKFSLGVAGIRPAADSQVNVNIELKAGYVIDLSEPGDPPAKLVNGTAIDAKPVE
jgi:ParB-like chromosome segregation protein Spo0J